MALLLADLITATTVAQAKTSLLATADSLELATDTWKKGGITRTIIATVAEVHAGFTTLAQKAIAGGLLDYAEGDWLTLLAKQVYDVDRIEATFASGKVTLTNSGTSTHVVAAGDVVVRNSTTDKTYRNTSGGTLNASSTLQLDILAEEAGSDSTSQAGTIDELVTTLLGVTVSNAAAVVGVDKELDPALRQRCRDSLGALSPNGPKAAYRFAVTTAKRSDGTSIGANRVKATADGNGGVTIYFALPTGAPTAQDVTDVDDAVQEQVVPIGITATVAGATNNTINITATLYVPADTDETDTEITTAAQDDLADYFETAPIGGFAQTVGGQGKIFHDELRGVIHRASAPTFTVDLTAPAADVNIAATEVPKLGSVTLTVTRVQQ